MTAKSIRIRENFEITLILVGLIWVIFIIDLFFPVNFRQYGIRPREFGGLTGIPLAPFLHASFSHIFANTFALFVLLLTVFSYNRRLAARALFAIIFLGGVLVWAAGSPNTVHIGASGVIFGLIGFLIFIGIFRREWKAMLFSIVIFMVYGGALFSLLRFTPGISWSGHFYGFLSGVAAAWWFRRR